MPDTTITVFRGDCYISGDPEIVFTTPLGSCISACIFDPVAGIGGMNHYLLPGRPGLNHEDDPLADQYGLFAMPMLVSEMQRSGARLDRMEAKLFGGSPNSFNGRCIGRANVDFAKGFLRANGIRISGGVVGRSAGIRVNFRPATGEIHCRGFVKKSWSTSHREASQGLSLAM